MTSKNGEIQAPQPRPDEVEMVQIPPIVTLLQGCRHIVTRRPDGMTDLVFVHVSGLVAYQATLTEKGCADLIRDLTGGVEIARSMPVMQ